MHVQPVFDGEVKYTRHFELTGTIDKTKIYSRISNIKLFSQADIYRERMCGELVRVDLICEQR